MRNLLEETYHTMHCYHLHEEDVLYVCVPENCEPRYFSFEKFKRVADRRYDEFAGKPCINTDTFIAFKDGSIMERKCIDFCEYWEVREPFEQDVTIEDDRRMALFID